MDLKLDEGDLGTCVQCGLCLPHCPTFRVTGDESRSPRGRIALMRHVQEKNAPLTEEVVEAFATCVQCRGCEPACPSSVPFGRLIERTRETLADEGRLTPAWQRLAVFRPFTKPRTLRAGSVALSVLNTLGLAPERLGLPDKIPLQQAPLVASGSDVWLFTGCVMDAWQRDVHHATQRVLEAAGFGVRPTGDRAPCCGALHSHAGLGREARGLAASALAALPEGPIVVNSAGCGAAMKEYGHSLGTEEARAFSARVCDVSEFLASHLERLPSGRPLDLRVAIQDPCHLRHVQRVHQATRTVLAPYVRQLVELEDDGLCCGAGGAYSLLQPKLARQIRDRKVAEIQRHHPDAVASANPGCSMHLAKAGVPTVHPMVLIDRALRAGEPSVRS